MLFRSVPNEEGSFSLIVSVKGVYCASCIQLIEKSLLAEKDVTYARVNMSTERLVLTWKGKKERGDALATIVFKLGYQLKPFDASNNSNKISEQEKTLLRCIAVAGFAMGNLMLISVGLWSADSEAMGVATRDLFHWISAIIALPTII